MSAFLADARLALGLVNEELGAVALHLREAADFNESTGPLAAVSSIDDCMESIDSAVRQLLEVRDKAGRWSAWAEEQVEGKEGA